MASAVYNTENIELQDGREVTLKPLAIGRLRRFMKAWQDFGNVENDDQGFNVFINCAGIALESDFKDDFDTLKATTAQEKKGEFLSEEYKTYLEDVLDLDTIYKILDVCGGLKLNDPKLLEAALRVAEQQDQDGTN